MESITDKASASNQQNSNQKRLAEDENDGHK